MPSIINREPSDAETREVIKLLLFHYIKKSIAFRGRYNAEIRLLLDLLPSS